MSMFESIASQIKDAKTPETGARLLLKDLIYHLTSAVNGANVAADTRRIRDELEKNEERIAGAIIQNTDKDRGPNAPDDSEDYPDEIDPLRRANVDRADRNPGEDNAPAWAQNAGADLDGDGKVEPGTDASDVVQGEEDEGAEDRDALAQGYNNQAG